MRESRSMLASHSALRSPEKCTIMSVLQEILKRTVDGDI